ncbi:MAG TPA: amidohydrolase family protein, partial [Thermoanaerobaculia bacterium]|nr:amidohydrolase family protein [Thermoanaerobaculia bacterium]
KPTWLLLILAVLVCAPMAEASSADLAAARALFEKNLQAIRDKNKDAYLACYLDSPGLARTGPTGYELGYADLAKNAGQGWPDHIEAEDLRLTPVRPGVVYGTYRYRVRYGAREDVGLSERVFLETPQGWRIAVSTAFSNLPGVPPPPRALVGATLLDGKGGAPVPDAVVLLRDGKIECAGPRAACPVPAGVGVVDLKGQWITPGLVDAHVHFSQTGWADGRPDALDVRSTHPYEKVEADLKSHPERFGRTYLCSGVTAVFDVGGYPWTLELAKRFGESTEVPHVVAAGPLLSTLDHWLNLPAERQFIYLKDAEVGRSGVHYLAEQGSRAVKVWFIPQESPSIAEMGKAVRAAGEEARKLGLPLIVHSTGLEEAKEALRAGAHLLVHSVWDKPIDPEFLDLLKANGTLYCPTLTVGRGYVRMSEGAVKKEAPKVDDPNGCVDPGTLAKVAETAKTPTDVTADRLAARDKATTERERTAAMNLKRVSDAGVTIAMGTDAGNPLTLHGPSVYAEMEAMQAAGLTPLQVLTASTRGGAVAMGLDKEIGTVDKGKVADLLIVGGDPAADVANLRKVRYVVRGGVLRSLAELQALATVEGKE